MKSCLLFGLLVATPLGASAESYHIPWSALTAGGGRAVEGRFSLHGSIGQPAATDTLDGARFGLMSGFWAGVALRSTSATPELTVQSLANGEVQISWSGPADGFLLEESESLPSRTESVHWRIVPFPYETNASRISISLPSMGTRFYRIRRP